MAKLANRAKMTISSTGTGNITLASAVAGYQSFLDAGVSDNDVIRYIVEDNNGADWEIGTASVSNNSTVLVRTVEESSAANNAALNLTSSAKVFIGVTAKDLDNAAPIFTTTPPVSLDLGTDGSTAVTLNAKAYDDESGIPIAYSWDAWASGGSTIYDSSSLPPQLASAPSINQSTGAFSLVGSSNVANAGAVNFRVKASDGVKVATHNTSLILNFGLTNCYGFDITQTSTSNGYTIFKFMFVAQDGSNLHDNTAYASEVVYGSNVSQSSWYEGGERNTTVEDAGAQSYFRTELSATFGGTLPASGSGSHFNYGLVANPSGGGAKTITWTTSRTIKGILVSGDGATPYFSGGYVTPYIGGNAASNLSGTSYTLIQGTTSSVANSRYFDFTA